MIIIYKDVSQSINQICSGHNCLVIPVLSPISWWYWHNPSIDHLHYQFSLNRSEHNILWSQVEGEHVRALQDIQEWWTRMGMGNLGGYVEGVDEVEETTEIVCGYIKVPFHSLQLRLTQCKLWHTGLPYCKIGFSLHSNTSFSHLPLCLWELALHMSCG